MARPDNKSQAQDEFLEKLVAVNRTAKVVKGGTSVRLHRADRRR